MATLQRRRLLLTGRSSRYASLPGPVTITPTLGAELIVNGNFSAWTADNPDGWSVSGESGSDPMVTQVASGGGAGTGLARLYTSSAALALFQDILTAGEWFRIGVNLDTRVAGSLQIKDNLSVLSFITSTVGVKLFTSRAGHARLIFQRTSGALDVTIDDASANLITFATTFYTISDAFVPRVVKAAITRTANTQAGVAHRSDDNNVVIAYNDGAGNVVLLKRVGGTYTQVATASAAYSAGAILQLDYDPAAKTYTVKYNGSTVIAAQSVTDAVFVTATGARLFSTYDLNSFSSVEASA